MHLWHTYTYAQDLQRSLQQRGSNTTLQYAKCVKQKPCRNKGDLHAGASGTSLLGLRIQGNFTPLFRLEREVEIQVLAKPSHTCSSKAASISGTVAAAWPAAALENKASHIILVLGLQIAQGISPAYFRTDSGYHSYTCSLQVRGRVPDADQQYFCDATKLKDLKSVVATLRRFVWI